MISCAHHDYVEIACLYRMPVILTLRSGEVVRGIALDTARDGNGAECLKLATGQLVVLEGVRTLEAAEPNPHFSRVDFTT